MTADGSKIVTPLAVPSLAEWLESPEVVAADGCVWSWSNAAHPGYRYPEAAGLLLNLLAQRDAHPDVRRRIVDGLVADTAPDGGIGRGDLRYVFDTAMSISGLLREQQTAGLPVPDVLARQYDFLRTSLRARRATSSAATPEGRWSTQYGCHLLKTALALTAFSAAYRENVDDLLDQLVSDLMPLAVDGRYRDHADVAVTYVHAHCYAIEGLLALSVAAPSLSVRPAVQAGAEWLARTQDATGGMRAWHDGTTSSGELRADATAQAVRIWALVDRDGFDRHIAGALGFLAQLGGPARGLRYSADSDDINTWSTIFAVQAIEWTDRPGDPSCIV